MREIGAALREDNTIECHTYIKCGNAIANDEITCANEAKFCVAGDKRLKTFADEVLPAILSFKDCGFVGMRWK